MTTHTTVYACSGSCHGVATKEQYDAGAKTCGATTCERHGMPLEPREQCESCAVAAAKDGKGHACEKCGKSS